MTIEPVTIGALRRDGRLLWCYCLDCQHEAEIDPGASGLADDIPVPEAGRLSNARVAAENGSTPDHSCTLGHWLRSAMRSGRKREAATNPLCRFGG